MKNDNVRLAHELLFGFGRAPNIHDALGIYHVMFMLLTLGELYYLGA